MSKVDKINLFMVLQQVNSAYVMSVLTKWRYFVSFLIFGVFSACILCINCKNKNFQIVLNKNLHRFTFELPKHFKQICVIQLYLPWWVDKSVLGAKNHVCLVTWFIQWLYFVNHFKPIIWALVASIFLLNMKYDIKSL